LCVNVAPPETAVEPAQLDLSLAALFVGYALNDAGQVDAATRLLRDVLQTQGADADIRRRRVRPPG
jgi:hypothetical protein